MKKTKVDSIKLLFSSLSKQLLFLLCVCNMAAVAQVNYCRNYSMQDGLPDDNIRALYKDSRNILWIGTDAGLASFDGSQFQVYSTKEGLIGNKIYSIAEDSVGNIWLACYGKGLSKFDGSKFISYSVFDGLINNNINVIHYSNRYNCLLIGTEDGLTIIKNEEFFSFHRRHKNISHRLEVSSIHENDTSILILTTRNGIYEYLAEDQLLNLFVSENPFNLNYHSHLHRDEDCTTFIGTNRKSLKVIKNKKPLIYNDIGQIVDMTEDNSGNIWMAAYSGSEQVEPGGLFRYNDGEITRFNEKTGIKSGKIWTLLYDEGEDILWVGSIGDGLYLYPGELFTYFNAQHFNLEELNVVDLYEDNSGHIWLLTNDLLIKKYKDGSFDRFSKKLFLDEYEKFGSKKILEKYSYFNDNEGSYQKYQELIKQGRYHFSNPYIELKGEEKVILKEKSLYRPYKYEILINKELKDFTHLSSDSQNNIWISSNIGLFKIDSINSIKFYDIPDAFLTSFTFDDDGKLYGLSWSDLWIYPDIERSTLFEKMNNESDFFLANIENIMNVKNEIWFSSESRGLFRYKEGELKSFKTAGLLVDEVIEKISVDYKGNLVVGTNSGEIFLLGFDNNSWEIKYKIDANYLVGNSIRWIQIDDDNYLWIGTNLGLNGIDLEELYENKKYSMSFFNSSEGFTDYSGNNAIVDENGNLWVGTNRSLVKADLEEIHKDNFQRQQIVLESIELDYQSFDWSRISEVDNWFKVPNERINLSHGQNHLTFYFTSINYLSFDKVYFTHILENFENKWSKPSSDRKLNYPNLPPGDYILKVKQANVNGKPFGKPFTFPFEINPPWWETWWFYVLVAILIWGILYLRIKQIKLKEEKKTEMSRKISELEMKALQSQMNPHFTFNAINSIQNYMLDNDIDSALTYLSDFAKIVRETLENASKKIITLDEELSYLKHYLNLELMRFDEKFDVKIDLEEEIDSHEISLPPMILQPYVENAIKHGLMHKEGKGALYIGFRVDAENSILNCIVQDDGVGRGRSEEINDWRRKKHKSWGSQITSERISILNIDNSNKYNVEIVDLFDEKKPSGTRIEIKLPLILY